MKVRAHKLIAITFVFSFISLLAAASALTFRIINDKTGFNLGQILPGCPNSYSNLKYSYVYIMLIVQFVANIIAAATALLRCILLIPPLLQVCRGDEQGGRQNSEKQVKLQVIYASVSLDLLCWILCMGGCLNVWIQASSCTLQFLFYNLLVGILSLVAGIISLTCWILVVWLNRCVKKNEIVFEDLKLNGQEDELSRRMDAQMREYVQAINRNKQQMEKELLAYEQEVYNSNKIKQEHQNKQNDIRKNISQEDSEYQYYYEEVEEGKEDWENGEDEIRQIEHQDQDIQPSPGLAAQDPNSLKAPNSPFSGGVSKRSKKEVGDLQVELLKVPNQNKQFQSNQEDENNNNQSQRNPSNKKMAQLSRNSSNSPKQKTQLHLKRVESKADDGWDQLQDFSLQPTKQPITISEQLNKLLKVTLFQNSPFFKSKKHEVQSECPLRKYLQRDQRFEVTRTGKFDKKNKKNQYSKEQLFFAKKRKDKMGQEEMYRNILKQEFNESLAVKRQRVDLLNDKLVEHIQQIEKDKEEQLATRYKKYNVLESIRSKYYN